MQSLSNIVRRCFEFPISRYGCRHFIDSDENRKYIVVPVSEDTIEVPVFALYLLDEFRGDNKPEDIAIDIKDSGERSYYKTLDSCMKETLKLHYRSHYMTRLPLTKGSCLQYYVTQGAVFDEKHNPIAMFTWKLEKEYTDNTKTDYKYAFVKPILRIVPDVILKKSTAVERYIINKIIPNVLSFQNLLIPTVSSDGLLKADYDKSFKAEVIINDIPFKIKKPDVPSISTTDKELLDIALNNIDDIMQ